MRVTFPVCAPMLASSPQHDGCCDQAAGGDAGQARRRASPAESSQSSQSRSECQRGCGGRLDGVLSTGSASSGCLFQSSRPRFVEVAWLCGPMVVPGLSFPLSAIIGPSLQIRKGAVQRLLVWGHLFNPSVRGVIGKKVTPRRETVVP